MYTPSFRRQGAIFYFRSSVMILRFLNTAALNLQRVFTLAERSRDRNSTYIQYMQIGTSSIALKSNGYSSPDLSNGKVIKCQINVLIGKTLTPMWILSDAKTTVHRFEMEGNDDLAIPEHGTCLQV